MSRYGAYLAAAVVFACAFGMGIPAHAEAEKDQSTTFQIEGVYLFNEWLNPFRINTTTRDGVVTLEGTVDDAIERRLAERIALSFDEVTRVDNQLEIDPDGKPVIVADTEEWVDKHRALRKRVQAANAEAEIYQQFVYSGTVRSSSDVEVEVDPDDFEVKLSGLVPDEGSKMRAERIALATSGITKVDNELDVADPTDTAKAVPENSPFKDEWIEKAVERQIAFNRYLNLFNFDVEVDNGICKLTGDVISEEQKELAAEIAGETQGVTSVTNDVKVVAWKSAGL